MIDKCEEHYCPWVRDTQKPDHYYCLRCKRERWVNRSISDDGEWFLWVILFVVGIGIAIALQ
ncbi:MAG TPA: hypothetical protein DCQ51_04270 [Planktothrix sp. UBA8407]|jgi:hypothetical protein|nr:hypothetical protein [Planktothrix sp. UBA8407]HBK21850.1 hypothetical protein [Planktothrix sp. UBA10369]